MRFFRKSFLFLFVFLCFIGASALPAFGETYETTAYNADLKVEEDNSFHVEIMQKVVFTQPGYGIQVLIPTAQTVTSHQEGKQVSRTYRLDVSNIQVPGYDFTTQKEADHILLKIGDNREYLQGQQVYRIRYDAALREDGDPLMDHVYWDMIPAGHERGISSGTVTVSMPKDFPPENVRFYTLGEGGQSPGGVTFSVEGLDISASLDRGYEPGEGLALWISLPEGYFSGEKTMLVPTLLLFLMILAAPALCVILWLLTGRDVKIIKRLQSQPPEDMTPAEAGYLAEGSSDSNDLVSMIIYWANQGLLIIEQKDKKDFILVRQKHLGPHAREYEKTMFEGLFAAGDKVSLSALQGSFYRIFSQANSQLVSHMRTDRSYRQFTVISRITRLISFLLIPAPFVVLGAVAPGIVYLPAQHTGVFGVLGILSLCCFLPVLLMGDKWENASVKQKCLGFVLPFFLALAFAAGMTALSLHWYHLESASVLACLSSFVCLLMTALMRKRTKRSRYLMGRLFGFREFIKTARPDELTALMRDNPQYFYDILPYAYAFELAERWAAHFEKLSVSPPCWYVSESEWISFNTSVFIHSFNSCSKSMTTTMSMPRMPQEEKEQEGEKERHEKMKHFLDSMEKARDRLRNSRLGGGGEE